VDRKIISSPLEQLHHCHPAVAEETIEKYVWLWFRFVGNSARELHP
jgi:hypothetical protein